MIIDYPVREFVRSVARRYRPPATGVDDVVLGFSETEQSDAIKIGFVGDICPLFGRTLEFSDALRDRLGSCDHLVGNFEGILTSARSRPFRLLHEERILTGLVEIADPADWTLSLANNHAGDFGAVGFSDTLEALNRRFFNTFGTSEQPIAEIRPGLVLSTWTRWMNRPSEHVPRVDPGPQGAFSIAYPHWGYEFTPSPDESMDVPHGYDLVVGHHPHIPLPLDVLDDGRPIAWSLGNFTTGNPLNSLHTGAVMIATFDSTVPVAGRVSAAGSEKTAAPRLRSLRFDQIVLDQFNRNVVLVRLRAEE